MTVISLRCNEDGVYNHTYTEEPDATWVLTDYSESPCPATDCGDECDGLHPSDCVVCSKPVLGKHFMCLDGGESAHEQCVVLS